MLTNPILTRLRQWALAAWGYLPKGPAIALLWAVGLALGAGLGLGLAGAGAAALAGWLVLLGLAAGFAAFAKPVLDAPAPRPAPPPTQAPKVPPPPPKPKPPPPLLDLVALPGGEVWMGSRPATDAELADWAQGWVAAFGGELADRIRELRDWQRREQPRHRVRLSAFAIARTPVTRGQWRTLLTSAPPPLRERLAAAPERWAARPDDADLPATDLDWPDALACCNALSVREGLTPGYRQDANGDWQWEPLADGYRLPTEAQWEYACRAGSDTWWFWGDDPGGADAHAWYRDNSEGRLQPVGQRRANRFGLHDMAGLVYEWCWDRYGNYPHDDGERVNDPQGPEEGDRRVVRGGAFRSPPDLLRSAFRNFGRPDDQFDDLGLRCVRSVARQQ